MERIGAGVPTGLQIRMLADKTVSGGFDSHPLRMVYQERRNFNVLIIVDKEYLTIQDSEKGPMVEFGLNARIEKEEQEDLWGSYYDRFKLFTYGNTEQQALEKLIQMIEEILKSLYERGELNRYLKKYGFKEYDDPVPFRETYVRNIEGVYRYIRQSFEIKAEEVG